ncbi:hypothetical protein [Haematomicrobium sanguinis]|uniref:hypothetical protein n=1 Tax=Haematomicrobium sanguinis TaxID=479106 RepID=UPI00047EA173|nr:hypothetical protein [Haematomicrobium sanguinis]
MKLITRYILTLLAIAATARLWLVDRCAATVAPREHHDTPERGDVPGWVLVTLMTALLVAGLLAIAWPALRDMLNKAMTDLNLGK